MQQLISDSLKKSVDYTNYRNQIDQLLEKGKTTGENHSEEMLHYTNLNVTRMKRLDKTTKVLPEVSEFVKGLSKNLHWLVITEAWCGDAAQIVPVIEAIAKEKEGIDVSVVLRDENPELMRHFLTNGGTAIPIIVVIDKENQEVLGHWGPRPAVPQAMVMERKHAENPAPYQEFVVQLQKWYAKDKTKSTQLEFLEKLKTITQ